MNPKRLFERLMVQFEGDRDRPLHGQTRDRSVGVDLDRPSPPINLQAQKKPMGIPPAFKVNETKRSLEQIISVCPLVDELSIIADKTRVVTLFARKRSALIAVDDHEAKQQTTAENHDRCDHRGSHAA